jgi:3-carboxy-cis,cis-muconate cycloisomerase
MEALADELGLSRAEPWHAARDRIEEFASLLAMIAASLGRIGADFLLLAANETGEIAFAGAGGSSTLPQKQNPVIAEVLVALARFAAVQVSALHHAAIHPSERDGAALTLEWLALPPLIGAAGAALLKAGEALATLLPDPARMRANLDATRGLVFAEAASFALATQMPRAEAVAIVKAAVAAVAAGGGTLFEELAARLAPGIDLGALADPRAGLGTARVLIERLVAEARRRG